MKKFFFFLLGLAVLIGIPFGIVIVALKAPPTVTAIMTGALGFIGSKLYETYQDNKRRNFETKKEIYLKLLEPYKDLLISAIVKKDVKAELDQKKMEKSVHAAFDAILYASDNVVKAYGDFRFISSQSVENKIDGRLILLALASLMKEMRKDIGEWTSINEVQLLMMFSNLTQNDKSELNKLLSDFKS